MDDKQMEDQEMSEYPEHDKISGLNGSNQTAGEFLDWIREEKGYDICEFKEGQWSGRYHAINTSTTKLVAEYFDIDLNAMELEKREMLQQCRDAHEAKDAEA